MSGSINVRINKYIAECGASSRRGAEELIKEKRVRINGKLVTDLSIQVNIDNDTVTLDNNKIEPSTNYVYIMLNKPKGCVATVKDDRGRKSVMDYVKLTDKRIFPIGRLDYDTEGLLLLTNDGDLSFRLTHPSNEIPKTYIVKIEGTVAESDLATLRKGIVLDDVKLNRCKIKLKEIKDNISKFEITIYEGKNRQIRKMFEAIGKNVIFLKRIKIGDLRLGGLARGGERFLNDFEIDYLKRL